MSTYTAQATIDLAALRANLQTIRTLTSAQILVAVKADAYGHGLIPIAEAAVDGGADWLGVAQLSEAIALREAGITAPVLAWLFTPHTTLLERALELRIDVAASDGWDLGMIAEAAKKLGIVAQVHLEVDTGMSRGGLRLPEFEVALAAAKDAEDAGHIKVVGLWTHLARADEPGDPSIAAQYEEFERANEAATKAGLAVKYRHVANSAATLSGLGRYEIVRVGLAAYGLSPLEKSPAELGLTPILRLSAELATVKKVPAGAGVSYGHTYTTTKDTRIGVVPLGYGDGIPRHASNHVTVQIAGQRVPLVGRVCMDQFMVDLGDIDAGPGDLVLVLGSGEEGEPTVHEWAHAIGTIEYEIVTRLGARIPRVYIDSDAPAVTQPEHVDADPAFADPSARDAS